MDFIRGDNLSSDGPLRLLAAGGVTEAWQAQEEDEKPLSH